MPNWLGDFIMALPHLKAMKELHPNAQLTLIAKPQFKDLIDLFHVADQFLPLPVGAAARFRQRQKGKTGLSGVVYEFISG